MAAQQFSLDRRRLAAQRRSLAHARLGDAQLRLEIGDRGGDLVGARFGERRGEERVVDVVAQRVDRGADARFRGGQVRPLDVGARTERRVVQPFLCEEMRIIGVVRHARRRHVRQANRERGHHRLILGHAFAGQRR